MNQNNLSEVLSSAYSVLSYIYHRERTWLTEDTQKQVYEVMCKVERMCKAFSTEAPASAEQRARAIVASIQGCEWHGPITSAHCADIHEKALIAAIAAALPAPDAASPTRNLKR